ncbi:unnamed protein product [Paramecium sonneborni]|uniref:Uncharacterized protein n=1 Tax=Paramecium sonneborni TaxID=65129 RepID=A0A8S1RLY6_9CILI|nr:unnamed protein product [Paramecium sonneborni]
MGCEEIDLYYNYQLHQFQMQKSKFQHITHNFYCTQEFQKILLCFNRQKTQKKMIRSRRNFLIVKLKEMDISYSFGLCMQHLLQMNFLWMLEWERFSLLLRGVKYGQNERRVPSTKCYLNVWKTDLRNLKMKYTRAKRTIKHQNIRNVQANLSSKYKSDEA